MVGDQRIKSPPFCHSEPSFRHIKQSRHLEKLDKFKAYNPTAAELLNASQRVYEPVDAFSRNERIAIWICSLIGGAIMIETLLFKFTGAPESKYIFSKPVLAWRRSSHSKRPSPA